VQGSDIHDDVTIDRPGGPGGALPSITTAKERLHWFGTVRGRLGVTPWDRTLLYATGGFAYGKVGNDAAIGFPFPLGGFDGFFSGSQSSTRTGWTVGGGLEHAWRGPWSVKLEYLYVDLGSDTVRLLDPFFPLGVLDYSFEHRHHLVRAGLNYRFGAPAPVAAKY
jgi:outer membrane immunogenic protein